VATGLQDVRWTLGVLVRREQIDRSRRFGPAPWRLHRAKPDAATEYSHMEDIPALIALKLTCSPVAIETPA
jgi:hypothetical protein